VVRYDIYQDEIKIGETTDALFVIEGVEYLHNFCVVAVYNNEEQSYPVCIEIECVPTGIEEFADEIRVYPNPATGELHVTSHSSLVTTIEVFDMYGRKQNAENRKQNEIDISELKAGIYFIRIQTEKGIIAQKIIKY
jgi:hypothetical protein